MFLFVLFYVFIYFVVIEKYKASFLSFLPAFLVYFFVAGMQYGVGTDYFSYVDIYENPSIWNRYYSKKEYLFYWLNVLLNQLSLPTQSLFLAFSLVNSTLLFVYFKKIKSQGFILSLFFFAFFCVTNIYNNQLNGLRQYVVIAALPLITWYLYYDKKILAVVLLLAASFFHNTAWIVLLFIFPLFILDKKTNISLSLVFVCSFFVYFILGKYLNPLVSWILPSYAHYLDSELSERMALTQLITKLYYLPLLIYFYFVYKKNHEKGGRYLHFMLLCASATYWFFILGLYLGIANRIYSYVIFFSAFPIYYLLYRSWVLKRKYEFLLIFLYVLTPYIAKVTFLAKAEFLYRAIIFN